MRAWIVWSIGLFAYIVAVLDRTTLGVSGLQAANRFGASPGVLSSFVVLQVVVYASAQVPAGVLLDKLGSKTLNGDVLVVIGRDYPHLPGGLRRPVPSTTAPHRTSTSGHKVSPGAGTSTTSSTKTTLPASTTDTRFVPTAKKGVVPLVGCP